jgi:ketopantoate reductase
VLEYIAAIDDVIAVVGVTKPAMLERRQARQVIFSCVSVVKDILAIRATFVIFPRQLFDLLRKNGGVLYYSRNQRGGD